MKDLTTDDVFISALPVGAAVGDIQSNSSNNKLRFVADFVEQLDKAIIKELLPIYLSRTSDSEKDMFFIQQLHALNEKFKQIRPMVSEELDEIRKKSLKNLIRLIHAKSLSGIFFALNRLNKISAPCQKPVVISGKVSAPLPPPPLPFAGKAAPPPMMAGKVSGKALSVCPPPIQVVGKVMGLPPPMGKFKGPPPTVAPQVEIPVDINLFQVPPLEEVAEVRRIHWQSLPVSRFRNSVFDTSMSREVCEGLDFDEVKMHFTKPVSSPSRSGIVPTAVSTPVISKISPVSILDIKRSQQVEIFLNGNKSISIESITEILKGHNMDPTPNVAEILESVQALYPSPEEIESISGSSNILAKADSFLFDLSRIPQFRLASNYLIIVSTIDEVISEIQRYFALILCLASFLQQSKAFPDLLYFAGCVVVYLNKKTNFNGYSIEQIPQLRKVTSFKERQISVLDIVVRSMGSVELKSLIDGLGVAQSLTSFEYSDMIARFDQVVKSVQSVAVESLDPSFYSDLIPILSTFKSRMSLEVDKLTVDKNLVVEKLKWLRTFLGENDKRSPDEIFSPYWNRVVPVIPLVMITLPPIDDLHVHLRQGELMEAVVPSITNGGVTRVLVMPNLSPPITSVAQAREYRNDLIKINPNVEYLMTLFLSPSLSIADLIHAKENHVVGIKSYPRGVTTGSDAGVEDYEVYYPIFAEMEKLGLSLHLHGEVPNTCVMKAEEMFLSNLFKLHERFPNLKIVLEHVTTEASINAVLACGPTVAATITVHHIDLTISDVVGNNINFCKPVAKLESDRDAIRTIIRSGNRKFFLGSDSAPHLLSKKSTHCGCPAGIFTQPHIALYVADCFDRLGCLDNLENFCCHNGAKFLGLPQRSLKTSHVVLDKKDFVVPDLFMVTDNESVVPYRAGQVLKYSFLEPL